MVVRILKSPRAEFLAEVDRAADGDEGARARLMALYGRRQLTEADQLRLRAAAADAADLDYHGRAGPRTFIRADGTPKAVDRRGDPLCPQGHEKTYWWDGVLHCRECGNANSRRYNAKAVKPPRLPRTHCRRGHALTGNTTAEGKCKTCERERKSTPQYRAYNRRYQREWMRAKRKRLQLVE